MCGGGPAFDDIEDRAEAPRGPTTASKPTDPDPRLMAAVVDEIDKKLRGRAARDFEGLRGYIETYRTRADHLEDRVGKWCDELEQQATEHDRTVQAYLKRYHHLEGTTSGLLARVRALEVVTRENAATTTAPGNNKTTCRCRGDDQSSSLAKRLSRMEGKMQALEDKCKAKDDKIQGLSARCDALYKKAARHEQDIRNALSSVPTTTTTTKAQSKAAEAAVSTTTTTVDLQDARLATLAQTVELHGHYFDEIRDRILQHEDASSKAPPPTSPKSPPQIKGLEARVAGAVAQAHEKIVQKHLGKVEQQLVQWSKELRDALSRQLDSLKKTNEDLNLKIDWSKGQTDAALTDLKASIGGQIAAHKEAVDAGTERRLASLNEKLADVTKELRGHHLEVMSADIQQHAGQLQELQSQHDELEARLREQATTTQPDDTSMAIEPVHPMTSVFQFGAFAALTPGVEPEIMRVQAAEEDNPMGDDMGPASGDQSMADVRGSSAAEQYQAESRGPSMAVDVPFCHDQDDLYPSIETEDEPMDLSSGTSVDDFVVKIAASDRGLEAPAAVVGHPDANRAVASQWTTSQSHQDDTLMAPQPRSGTADHEIQIPGLGLLPREESPPRSDAPSPASKGELVADMENFPGFSNDSQPCNPVPAPAPSPVRTDPSQSESKIEARSPFPGNIFTIAPKALPASQPLKSAAQTLQPGETTGSQSTIPTTANPPSATPVRPQRPLPRRRSPKPALPSPLVTNVPQASAPPASPPSPPTVAPCFCYSANYVDGLRKHIYSLATKSFLAEEFCGGAEAEIDEIVRGAPRDAIGNLAERAGVAEGGPYPKLVVEQFFSDWFETFIVPEMDDLEELLKMSSFEKKEVMGRFMEQVVHDYMSKHAADRW